MTNELDFTICPVCEEGYTDSFTTCPNKCGKRIQSPKIVPKTKVNKALAMDTLLSYVDYQKASPNKVSVEEYNRYTYLHGLQTNGYISNLELQITYDLLPKVTIANDWYSFVKPDGKTRKGFTQSAITYSPDFRYTYNGRLVIEEYKGVTRTKAGNYRPRIKTVARNKVKMWIAKYADKLSVKEWFFCISGWNQYTKQYTTFDSNGNIIDYPLAN